MRVNRRLDYEIVLFLLGICLGLTYPTDFLIAIIPVLIVFSDRTLSVPKRLMEASIVSALFLIGILTVCLIFYFKFDRFWLYFEQSKEYSRTESIALTVLYYCLKEGSNSERLTVIWFGVALGFFIERKMKLRLEVYIYLLAVFLFSPGTGSSMSIYRHYVLMVPLCILIASSSRHFLIKLVFGATGLGFGYFYFLPLYINKWIM